MHVDDTNFSRWYQLQRTSPFSHRSLASFIHIHSILPRRVFQTRKTTFIVSYQYPHPLWPSSLKPFWASCDTALLLSLVEHQLAQLCREHICWDLCDLSPPMRVSTGEYYPELLVSKLVSSYFYTKHIHDIILLGVFGCARALRTSFHVKISLSVCGVHKIHNFTVCRKLNLFVFFIFQVSIQAQS